MVIESNPTRRLRGTSLAVAAIGLASTVIAQPALPEAPAPQAPASEAPAAEAAPALPQAPTGGSIGPDSLSTEEKMQQIGMQIQMVQNHLQSVERQATQRDDVQAALTAMREVVETEAIEADPEKKERIERFFVLQAQLADLAAVPQEERDTEAMQGVVTEMRGMESDLTPALRSAMSTETAQAQRQSLSEVMMAAMKEIDGNVTEYMEKQQQLINVYRQLQQMQQQEQAVGAAEAGGEADAPEAEAPEASQAE